MFNKSSLYRDDLGCIWLSLVACLDYAIFYSSNKLRAFK